MSFLLLEGAPLGRAADSREEARRVVEEISGFANRVDFDPMAEGAPRASSRAERFPIHIPVRYREPRSVVWFEGKTENISRSGVLFRTESVLSPKTTVEMRFMLPAAIKDEAPCEILCKGVVVRTEQTNIRGTPPALAVKIQRYRFARGRRVN